MTPDVFEQAQQLFLDAINQPEDKRLDYVREHAPSNDVVKEVLSLLRFHDQETVLRDDRNELTGTLQPLDVTIELPSSQTPDQRTLPLRPNEMTPSAIGRLDLDPVVDISERFVRSTNQLLQQRLFIATILLAGIMVFVTIAVALFDQVVPIRLFARGVAVALLGFCGWYVKTHSQMQNHVLRTFELLVVATPLTELTLIHWFETTELLETGEAIQIEELRAIIYTVASIYIAVYGIFIPSNWRRTAIITGLIALLPTIVSLTHQYVYQSLYPPEVQWMHFANPTLIGIMAFVATVGAGIVHQVRREAESAKHYGQYQLIDEIGRGGMGIVYLGKHQMLKRPAAIKLIRSESAGSPQAIQQFEKEVQATATLSHWNTVQIYDYGTTEEGDFYCVMEYLKGLTLLQAINRQGELPVNRTLDIIIQLCNGLQEAHAKGLVHRDIKPANIFLAEIGGQSDVVKVLDFGLVVTSAETGNKDDHLVGGTPAYMSPEQIRGEPLDGRSDIYAIGCLMYECLTGRPPFQALTVPQLVSNQLFKVANLNAVSKIDVRLESLISKCLEKQPDNRFTDVAELRQACQQILTNK